MTVARALLVALVLLLGFPAGSAAAQQLVPPETLAQEQTPPETQPQEGEEDDEELGEEIPDEQEQTPDEPDGGSGGGGSPNTPADPPARAQQTLPRTGQDPLPMLAMAATLLAAGLALRAAVNRS